MVFFFLSFKWNVVVHFLVLVYWRKLSHETLASIPYRLAFVCSKGFLCLYRRWELTMWWLYDVSIKRKCSRKYVFFLFSRVVLSTKIRIVDNYIIIISKLYPFTYFGIYKSLPLEYLSLTFLDEGISRQALCSHTIYKVVSLSLSGLLDLIREKHF